MRTLKKLPRKQLEKFSTVFTQLGLVLALFIVFISLEHQTKIKELAEVPVNNTEKPLLISDTPVIFVKQVEKPQKVKQVDRKVSTNLTKIEKRKNDDKQIIETVIDKPKDNEKPNIVDIDKVKTVDLDEDIDEKDDPVNIAFVEEIPIFAGCEGLSKTESRKCLDKKLQRLVQRYFDTDLANKLSLSSGKKRIFTQFVIDKEGNVTDVKINAPHPRLAKETRRIVQKIPRFTPGNLNGKKVKVKYMLPITFKVE